jgi:acyl dehydratase
MCRTGPRRVGYVYPTIAKPNLIPGKTIESLTPGRLSAGRHAAVRGCVDSAAASPGARLPVNTEAIGRSYPPAVYAVGREKVKEYAAAVGETNPIHLDPEAGRGAGYADVVAPPMFAVVYSAPAIGRAILDPDVGINLAAMVHGGQELVWGPPVVAGDEITTTASVKEIYERDGRGFYVFETISTNQDGETVCRGTWTNIVRGV